MATLTVSPQPQLPDPSASEWNQSDIYGSPSVMEHSSLDPELLQHVKDLHVQVANYFKALPLNEECIAKTVDAIIECDCPLPAKFFKVNVADLIKKNKHVKGPDSLSTLISTVGLLEKYGRNLMKPERPPLWKCINFANGVFRTRVDIIKGARDVLQLMGYSEVVEDGLNYPSDVDSPDLDTVAMVTTDLAIAKREIELYTLGTHPHAYRFKDCLDGTMAVIQVPGDSPTALPQSVFVRRPGQGARTVYENVSLPQLTQGRRTDQFLQSPKDGSQRGQSGIAPAVALNKPNPYLSAANSASQIEGILRKIGEPVTSTSPLTDVGLGYFSSTPGNTAPSTVLPSSKLSTQPLHEEMDKPIECVMCGKAQAKMQCRTCSGLRCEFCDKQWHLHPNRRDHQRNFIQLIDTSPSPVLPCLLCNVCGITWASVFCVDCSSSTCSGEYCSECDKVYHGHPLRQDHHREPLTRMSDMETKTPPKNIVLSLLPATTTRQETSKETESSRTSLKKGPVPAPRRSLNRSPVFKEPSEPLIPEETVLQDDVFTTKEVKETEPEIKWAPAQRTTIRTQSESTAKDKADDPVSPKPYHSVPTSERDIMSEVQTVVQLDINVLQKIKARREMMATCDKSLPTYRALQVEIASLLTQHNNLEKRQKELESMNNNAASAEVAAETVEEPPQLKYPPAKDYQELPLLQATNTSRAPFTTQGPGSKPSIAAKPSTILSTSQQSPQIPAVQSHPEVTPTLPPVATNIATSMQPGIVQQMTNRISAVPRTPRLPVDSSQAPSGAWVCLQCGNHNTASPVCLNCRAPMAASNNQKSSVAALGKQLGAIPMPVPQHQLQTVPFKIGMKPVPTVQPSPEAFQPAIGGATSGGAAVLMRTPLNQPQHISVFTYLQMEEEAMLKEKQKAKEEYERQMAAQNTEKPKMPSPPPRIKKTTRKHTAPAEVGSPTSPGTKQKPNQGVLLQPTPQDASALPLPVSLSRPPLWAEEKKRLDEQRAQSLAFIDMLKEVEDAGYLPEEAAIASEQMQEDEKQTVGELRWLQGNLDNYVSTVTTMATNHLKTEVGKSIGMVRRQEAKQALRKHHGNVEKAVEECVTQMQRKVLSLVDLGFSHKHVCEALSTRDGSMDDVLAKLQREGTKEFIDRIWCPEDTAYLEKMIVDLGVARHPDTVERRLRILLVEYELPSWGRASTATTLIDMGKYNTTDAITAARECGDIERATQFLEKSCSVCYGQFSMNNLSTLMHCQCLICLECLHGHFHIVINNRNILSANCPSCSQPDLRSNDLDATADYFGFLDILLKGILDDESYQLFQNKMRDWNLMREDNFRWCAHCGNGFINEAPNRRKMRCNACNMITCFQCKKPWMEQHENISCAEFQAWKEANDPNRQAEGLAIHLKENGIDCPHCKMRYELAKGGCMHFKCVQCTHEFCSGCSSPFKKANECGRFQSCRNRGLHAHHPRDCLFYLRDLDLKALQKLLQKHNVDFKRDNPANQQPLCSVMEQKELSDGLTDDRCGREAVQAGLCRLHYAEYLVSMINQNHIDPADEYNAEELEIILTRNVVAVPARGDKENEAAYKARLLQEVKRHLPLEKKNPRDRCQSL